ncbi:hypothetical protein HQ545_04860 [Candidatus Woesearchaeota archaeon]|nr:hypothetical protein [Candidatus Woesearchaeota archaeon]
MNKKIILTLIISISLLIMLSGCAKLGEEQAGQAPKKLKMPVSKEAPTAAKQPATKDKAASGAIAPATEAESSPGLPAKTSSSAPRADGCYLRINDDSHLLTRSDKDECRNLFIALENKDGNNMGRKGKIDFHRLLKMLDHEFGESEITDARQLQLYYKEGDHYDYFDSVKSLFSQPGCEWIEFFDIRLYCFNEVTGTVYDRRTKQNNLRFIIPYFTMLKYTSNIEFYNPLVGETSNAFEFMLDTDVTFYDATEDELFDESGCSDSLEMGAAAKNKEGGGEIYICPKMLHRGALGNKISYTAILYHEANHNFDELSHNERLGHITCEEDDPTHNGDRDFTSVYGAHIAYLFSMSQNDILPSCERLESFKQAEFEMKNKLCQRPIAPSHRYTKPRCMGTVSAPLFIE